MNCIVTAGPTFEPLDDVRRLTNFSTGRLGTELANFFAARGHRVTLLVGEAATYAGERQAQSVKTFSTTADLRAKLKAYSGKKVDAIFHAAAVSDFTFGQIFSETKSGEFTALKAAKKISTRQGALLVELLTTPKIIAELRGWFPQTKIVGWKFEADGGRAGALRAAEKQIVDCATDFCVANGPAYGKGFNLVTADGQKHLASVEKLFATLESWIVG
jgi:phosphopantothenoylcysteine decarboxylase/phosphopantothenate--cysteine ligase